MPFPKSSAEIFEGSETSVWLAALRDIAIVALLLTLFGAADTWARLSYLTIAKWVSIIDGLLVGALIAALAHEWGHYAGARLSGGQVPLKPIWQRPPFFDFNDQNHDARSFLWMSIGGSLGNWGAALLLAWSVPLVEAGPNALVSGAVGLSVFAALAEFPVIARAREGIPGHEALEAIPRDFIARFLPYGLGTAFALYIIL